MSEPFVALFFVIDDKILLHKCRLENAEHYAEMRNYPRSHMDVWERHYKSEYHVDFDFYPRGRVIYDMRKEEFYIYYDPCCAKQAMKVRMMLGRLTCKLKCDPNYICNQCKDKERSSSY